MTTQEVELSKMENVDGASQDSHKEYVKVKNNPLYISVSTNS
jgi:hypothetical protein